MLRRVERLDALARAQHPAPLLNGIYAIVNDTHADPPALVQTVLDAGVRIVQYRAKHFFNPAHAFAMRESTRACGAIFLLNDRWREVERFDADGAHVGPDDADFAQFSALRAALGTRILGISCASPEEARLAHAARADYLGVGAVFATSSKADAGVPIGIDGLRRVAAATPLPVTAIGGITLQNLAQVRAAGVAMAAVISAIDGAPDPFEAASSLVRAWNSLP